MSKTETTYEMRVAAKLRARRLGLDLSQTELAQAVGISPRNYAGWEIAERLPSGRMLVKLAEFYKCAPDELFK